MTSLKLGPVLHTPRLILRPPSAEDLPALTAFAADAETMRFIGGVAPAQHAWRALMTFAGCWALQGFAMFSVIERSTGRWVGRLGPWEPYGWPGTEVGWGITRDVWGRGYAGEGAAVAIDWAIEQLGWTDIIHCIDPNNVASRRVAEKLGAVNRGPSVLPAPFDTAPIDIWGQSASDWRANRTKSHFFPSKA